MIFFYDWELKEIWIKVENVRIREKKADLLSRLMLTFPFPTLDECRSKWSPSIPPSMIHPFCPFPSPEYTIYKIIESSLLFSPLTMNDFVIHPYCLNTCLSLCLSVCLSGLNTCLSFGLCVCVCLLKADESAIYAMELQPWIGLYHSLYHWKSICSFNNPIHFHFHFNAIQHHPI